MISGCAAAVARDASNESQKILPVLNRNNSHACLQGNVGKKYQSIERIGDLKCGMDSSVTSLVDVKGHMTTE